MSSSGLSEKLIARLEAGDDRALVDLFALYRERLKRMLEFRMDLRLRGRADASDILQEVYIDAHQRLRHYFDKPDISFYVWLRQLTQQRLIDTHRRHLKAQMRNAGQEVSLDRTVIGVSTSTSMAPQLAAQLASPSQLAMRAELLEQIEGVLDSMDPIDREVLALRHFEELRNSEVAQVLNIKEAAASNRYIRALTRLRDALETLPGFSEDL